MKSVKLTAAACATLALAGCSSQSAPDAVGKPTTANGSEERISVSRTVTYDSLQDLAKATPVIARVRIGNDATMVPADRAGTSGLTVTVVTVDVVKVIKGDLPGEIPLRLMTSPDADSEVPAPLTPGGDYVLFLTPFEWEHGKPTGEWTVSGGAGIYQISGKGALQRVDRGPDRLPTSIGSVDDLQGQLP